MKNQSKFAQFRNELEVLNKEEMKIIAGGYGQFSMGWSGGGGGGGGSFAQDNTYVKPVTMIINQPQNNDPFVSPNQGTLRATPGTDLYNDYWGKSNYVNPGDYHNNTEPTPLFECLWRAATGSPQVYK